MTKLTQQEQKDFERLLSQEPFFIENDADIYLECLNGKPLKDRTTPQEKRDGLILVFHVYHRIRGSGE